MNQAVDVGVITVVPDETRAFRDTLKKHPEHAVDQPIPGTVRRANLGNLPSKDPNDYHSVVNMYALDQGNYHIMPVYEQMVSSFKPKLIVLLGMSGRVHEKIELCDVVIATQVLDHDRRAIKPDGVEHDLSNLPGISPWLLEIIRRMQTNTAEEMKFKAHKDSLNRKFSIHIGPIGSGAAVIKDDLSDEKEWLRAVSRKTLNVATEEVGVATQFDNDQLKDDLPVKGYMSLRGIQDGADPAKDKKYRYASAANACRFLEEFLKFCSKGFEEELPKHLNP